MPVNDVYCFGSPITRYSFSDTGGATYCGVAALQLMGFIGADICSKQAQSAVIDVPLLVEWSLKVCCNVNIMGSNERFGTVSY